MAAAPRPESGETVAVGEAGLNFQNSFPLSKGAAALQLQPNIVTGKLAWYCQTFKFFFFFFEKPGNDILKKSCNYLIFELLVTKS